nr:immunoglobulin heavy chain junction region [Macaca mulatta]
CAIYNNNSRNSLDVW